MSARPSGRKLAARLLHLGVLVFFTGALAFPFFWMLIAVAYLMLRVAHRAEVV